MKRSKQNLSHNHLLSAEMGKLIPVSCVEALPGDTIQQHTSALVRVSPLAAPVMHPVTARIHHFFVPNRIIWDGLATGDGAGNSWENFITGGPDGLNAETPPTITTTTTVNNLEDYFGIPRVAGIDINALPFRAYNKVFNEFYRDQDLVSETSQDATAVQNIAWEKDYFTAARPWTQKGPDVTLPLGAKAPVAHDLVGGGQRIGVYASNTSDYRYMAAGGVNLESSTSSATSSEGLYADLTNAIGGDINDVRKAFAIQRYQEARSRYGSRYTEYLRYLGVNPKDARLQRPEYLGGGHTQINFSEIMQTAPNQTIDSTPTGSVRKDQGGYGPGDLYGHGIAAMRSNKYRRFIEEHGYVISMLSVRPKAIYQDGIHRSFLRTTKEDYYQRELEHIGQQEIYNNEIYAATSGGMDTFGYNDRYREYREHPSRVSAEYRDTLDYWHMARQFASAPTLNASFVECDPTKRIYNASTNHALWIMCQNRIVARRMLSRNAAPRIF